jgi:hypothetical protein
MTLMKGSGYIITKVFTILVKVKLFYFNVLKDGVFKHSLQSLLIPDLKKSKKDQK